MNCWHRGEGWNGIPLRPKKAGDCDVTTQANADGSVLAAAKHSASKLIQIESKQPRSH
jgi:hypothetical protein